MKKSEIFWKNDGWTTVQEVDAKKHLIGIDCRADDGSIVEVRIRHNDGEEAKGKIMLDGKNILPISIDEFNKLYAEGKLEIR